MKGISSLLYTLVRQSLIYIVSIILEKKKIATQNQNDGS